MTIQHAFPGSAFEYMWRTRFDALHGSLALPFSLFRTEVFIVLLLVFHQKAALRVHHLGQIIIEVLS